MTTDVKASIGMSQGGLTSRWSGSVRDKVQSPFVGVRAAQLKR